MLKIASVINVPISFFFDDMPRDVSGPDAPPLDSPTINKETVALVQHYDSINRREVKRRVRELVRALGDET